MKMRLIYVVVRTLAFALSLGLLHFLSFSFFLSLIEKNYDVTLTGLELAVWTKLVSNSKRSTCLCLQSARLKECATGPYSP